jgi:hypothetical protein
MSTIKSSSEHLTLNADGASKDIKFQANGVEKASISSSGAFTSTTIDATALTGALPAIDGSSLTGIEGVPSGIISMWSGAAAAIPSGWVLCDGNNSTPNLVGKFIKGGSTAGTTGGSNTHSHSHTLSAGSHTLSTSEMPSHTHTCPERSTASGGNQKAADVSGNQDNLTRTSGSTGGGGSHSHSLSGSIANGSNEPAYYELCYIMKS